MISRKFFTVLLSFFAILSANQSQAFKKLVIPKSFIQECAHAKVAQLFEMAKKLEGQWEILNKKERIKRFKALFSRHDGSAVYKRFVVKLLIMFKTKLSPKSIPPYLFVILQDPTVPQSTRISLLKKMSGFISKKWQLLASRLFDKQNADSSEAENENRYMFTRLLNEEKQSKDSVVKLLQKLFIDMVKLNIRDKQPYTIALGFKIALDGKLTMELLPIDEQTKYYHNQLLAALYKKPNDPDALKKLRDLQNARINLSKSAECFFPKIIVLDDFTNELRPETKATYRSKTNTIFIRSSWLSIENIQVALHEFVHRLQFADAMESGGVHARPLSAYKYNKYEKEVAIEIEACRKSIENHPDPYQLLEALAPHVTPFDKTDNELNFPYYSKTCEFAIAYKQCLKKGLDVKKFEKLYITASGHYNSRKNLERELFDIYNLPENSNLGILFTLIKYHAELKRIELITAFEPFLQQENNLSIKKIEEMGSTIAKRVLWGSRKLFNFKQKLGFMPQ